MKPNSTQMANPRDLAANPWNTNSCSPEAEMKLDESVRKLGMFKPILVRELPNGTLQILGGEHRVESSIRVGLSEIPIFNLGPIDDIKAKQIGIIDNARYGEDDQVGLAKLLEELMVVDDVTLFMPFDDSEMKNIFKSVNIDLDSLDLEDESLVPLGTPSEKGAKVQTHQIMRFRVQVEDSQSITDKIERVMRLQGFDEKDALTNAGDAFSYIMSKVEI